MAAETASDQEALLQLVQRLLIEPYPGAPTAVELHAGRLPHGRLDLPLPPEARLLGSAVFRRSGAIAKVEAVADVPGAQADVVRAYENQLRQAGWGPFGFYGGGFAPTNSGMPRTFRHGRNGPALVINDASRDKRTTALRLRLDWEMPRQMPHRPHHDLMERLPSLLAPPDVELEGGGSGGGESSWSSSATAHTDMPASDLEAYFAEQLLRADWTRLAGDAHTPLAWSAWNVPGPGTWLGLLLVVAFGRGERSLAVHMHAPVTRRSGAQETLTRRPLWRRVSFKRPWAM